MSFKQKGRIRLRRYVLGNFFKAALLPLLFIELVLVILYFSINSYNNEQAKLTLHDASISHLKEIVSDRSQLLSREFEAISQLGHILQRKTEYFFAHPELQPFGSSAHYELAPNGVYYRSDANQTAESASLYYSSLAHLDSAAKEKAFRSELLDPILKNIHDANRNIVAVYLNTYDSMNRYYPFIDKVYDQFLADMNIPEYNFYYLADARHNPQRGVTWTETYLDPAGQGWMMSCIAPIYRNDFLEGVAGIDVTVEKLIDNILKLNLPWGAEAFLVDASGTVMAMPEPVEQVLGLTELRKHVYENKVAQDTFKPEEFNLLKSGREGVAATMAKLLKQDRALAELTMGEKNYYICQASVPESKWKLMVLANKDNIIAPIVALEKTTKHIGYWAVAGMVLFYLLFFGYLLRNAAGIALKISVPVADIARRSAQIAASNYDTRLTKSGIDELDTLGNSFNNMVTEIQQLHDDLRKEIDRANGEIEERKRAQEELYSHQQELIRTTALAEAANRAKSVFLSKMSHELRTPMHHIIGFTELLASNEFGETNPRQQKLLGNVLSSSHNLLELINDVLELSQLESDKVLFEASLFDPRALLEQVAAGPLQQARENGLQSDLILGELPQQISSDRSKLEFIINSMLDMSTRLTQAPGRLQLQAERLSGDIIYTRFPDVDREQQFLRLCITISEDKEDSRSLEERLRQFGTSTKNKPDERPQQRLGYSQLMRFVELHGGRMWCESVADGSCCCVAFPIG